MDHSNADGLGIGGPSAPESRDTPTPLSILSAVAAPGARKSTAGRAEKSCTRLCTIVPSNT